MKKREDRRILMTKRMLKSALTEMLKEMDIYNVSIRELCERADVNRTTFYKHYRNQFDLLDEMENDLLHSIEKTIENVAESNGVFFVKLLVFLEENLEFVRLFFNANVDPDFPKKLFSLAVVIRSMEKGMKDVPRNELEYVNRFMLSGIYEMIHFWLNKEDRESSEKMAAIIMERFRINLA